MLYKCKQCSHVSNQKGNFNNHLMIHTTEKHFKCEQMQKTSISIANSKQHAKMHSDQKAHRCKECQKGFSCTEYLNRHLLIHSGLRPSKCTICNLSSLHVNGLKFKLWIRHIFVDSFFYYSRAVLPRPSMIRIPGFSTLHRAHQLTAETKRTETMGIAKFWKKIEETLL